MKPWRVLPLFAVPMLLTSCIDDGSGDYNTPERFLEHVTTTHSYLNVHSSETMYYAMDYGLVVKEEILKIPSFSSVDYFNPSTERFMIYEMLISNSMGGPNYSNLFIFADGSTMIEYKTALGPLKKYYFKCDEDKASALNDFVESYLTGLENEEKDAQSMGEEMVSIPNFVEAMKEYPYGQVESYINNEFLLYKDYGDLLDVIGEATYVEISEREINEYFTVLSYESTYYDEEDNYIDKPHWGFGLYRGFDHAVLSYDYIYKEKPYHAYKFYSLDEAQGRAIKGRADELIRESRLSSTN